ncbi:MAG: hypothetical protein EOO29_44085, partial [Comamonadaceae bacterium]
MTRNTPTTAALRARWQSMAPREQSLVLAAGGLIAFALLWWLAVAPALATLRTRRASTGVARALLRACASHWPSASAGAPLSVTVA